jgi:hypothetical protein
MEKPMIYEAMAAVMADVKAIGKTSRNTSQNFMFRGIDAVMNELHSIFAKHKVFIVPETVNYTVDRTPTKSGSIMYQTRATIKYHFTAIDGSEVVVTTVGEAMDMADKGMNKAMSIALKYALMQILLIPTEEMVDPDATTPENTRNFTIAELANNTTAPETLKNLLCELSQARTVDELQSLFNTHAEYQEKTFKKYFTQRKNELLK